MKGPNTNATATGPAAKATSRGGGTSNVQHLGTVRVGVSTERLNAGKRPETVYRPGVLATEHTVNTHSRSRKAAKRPQVVSIVLFAAVAVFILVMTRNWSIFASYVLGAGVWEGLIHD